MKRQAIKIVLISNHRGTEATEAFYSFAHRETAMGKDISPCGDCVCPKGRNFSFAGVTANEKIKFSVLSAPLWWKSDKGLTLIPNQF